MSHPSESSPTHHGRHAALATVAALLGVYFLVPGLLSRPMWEAERKGYITRATALSVAEKVFAPINYLVKHSQPYANFLEAERDLWEKVFGDP